MRTTVTIDDELYQKALAMADADMEKSELADGQIQVVKRVGRLRHGKGRLALERTHLDL